MPTLHYLKVDPLYFEAVRDGRKPFEIRDISDRNFKFGDTLMLSEWDKNKYIPYPNDPQSDRESIMAAYTGRTTSKVVTYVLTKDVLYKGKSAAVLGLAPVAVDLT